MHVLLADQITEIGISEKLSGKPNSRTNIMSFMISFELWYLRDLFVQIVMPAFHQGEQYEQSYNSSHHAPLLLRYPAAFSKKIVS